MSRPPLGQLFLLLIALGTADSLCDRKSFRIENYQSMKGGRLCCFRRKVKELNANITRLSSFHRGKPFLEEKFIPIEQKITPPRDPETGLYLNQTECVWILRVQGSRTVAIINFEESFDVRSEIRHGACRNDYIRVRYVSAKKHRQKIVGEKKGRSRFCSGIDANGSQPALPPSELRLHARVVEIRFFTDDADEGRGFVASFRMAGVATAEVRKANGTTFSSSDLYVACSNVTDPSRRMPSILQEKIHVSREVRSNETHIFYEAKWGQLRKAKRFYDSYRGRCSIKDPVFEQYIADFAPEKATPPENVPPTHDELDAPQ